MDQLCVSELPHQQTYHNDLGGRQPSEVPKRIDTGEEGRSLRFD